MIKEYLKMNLKRS